MRSKGVRHKQKLWKRDPTIGNSGTKLKSEKHESNGFATNILMNSKGLERMY